MSVGAVIKTTTYQGIGGLAIGTLVDKFFPAPVKVDSTAAALKTAAEMLLEMGVDAFMIGALFDFMSRNGLPATVDPVRGVLLAVTLQQTQPNLLGKITSLSNYITTSFHLAATKPTPAPSNAQTSIDAGQIMNGPSSPDNSLSGVPFFPDMGGATDY